MLALLERVVTDAGGTYACCDTDSMAIVATRNGGLVACNGGPHKPPDGTTAIRALSWSQVDEIVERFAALNPYDKAVIPGSVLKIEHENYDPAGEQRELWCYAISAKRYCLYTPDPDGPAMVKALEHGLGYLLNPTDPASENRAWITQLWQHHVRHALHLPSTEPDWLDRVACTQLAISKPNVLTAFTALNADKPYAQQLKPFSFMLCAHTKPFGHPTGANATTFQPIAPYERDSASWLNLPWIDKHTGHPVQLSPAGPVGSQGTTRVQTYRDVVKRHATHPEPKALDPDGTPCRRDTHGLLSRRLVTTTRILHIGKEANDLTERQAATTHTQTDVLNTYTTPTRHPWPAIIRPAAQLLSPTLLAANCSTLSRSQIKSLLRGDTAMPQPAHVHQLRRAVARLARDDLTARGLPCPKDDLDCCWLYARFQSSGH